MAALILPRRFTQQPQYPAEIDTSRRLFDPSKLSCILNPAVAPSYDLVQKKLHPSTGIIQSTSSIGKSLEWNKSAQYITIATDADTVLDTVSCTMLIATVRRDSTVATYPAHGYENGAADIAGLYFPYTDNNVYWDFGNATEGSGRLSMSMASYLAAGTVNIWAFVAGSRGREIWRNGERLANNTSATATRPSTTREFRVGAGHSASGTTSPNDHTSLFVLSREQLTESALEELTTNPWQFFRHRPQVLYFDVGGGVTGSLSATLADFTSSIVGTTTIVGTISQTLTSFTSNIVGTSEVGGNLVANTEDAVGVFSGTAGIVGTIESSFASFTGNLTGTTTVVGNISTQMEDTLSDLTGTTTVVGTITTTSDDIIMTANGFVGSAPINRQRTLVGMGE